MSKQTISKEKEISAKAVNLKNLLRQSGKQDIEMGDVSRWEHIPQQYIITANTLGIELNDSVLEKLNNSEDKEAALYSVIICQYFKDKARKEGKLGLGLAIKLETLLENDLRPEEMAACASRLVEENIPKDELKKAFENVYRATAGNMSKAVKGLCNRLKKNRPESKEKLVAALQDAKMLVSSLEEVLESILKEEIEMTPGKYKLSNYYDKKVYDRNGNNCLGKIVAVHFDPVTMQAEWLLKRKTGFFKKEYVALPLPLQSIGGMVLTRFKPRKTEDKTRFKRIKVLDRKFRPKAFEIDNKGKILRFVYRCDKRFEGHYKYTSIDADNIGFENNSIMIKDLMKVKVRIGFL